MLQSLSVICLLLTGCLLLTLAQGDLRQRRLSNRLVSAYALLFLPHAWLVGLQADQIGGHVLLGALGFCILLGLFMLGVLGGGDVKLGTVLALWTGPALIVPVLLWVSLSGAGLAVLGWVADRNVVQRSFTSPCSGVRHALSARRGVPYGVALAIGGLWVLWIRSRL